MNRVIVLAHFDPDGTVDDYVIDALRHYRQVASRVVMVSASTDSPQREVRSLVDTFIARENTGHDFCSWRVGIESLGSLDGVDELICVNDSVYGPMRNLAPVIEHPSASRADAWGMCLSTQGVARRGYAPIPHIQSWFIAMRSAVLRSDAFRQFWMSVEPVATKAEVIERYEIGLSQCLSDAGFRLAGIHDARTATPVTWGEIAPMVSLADPVRSIAMLRRACRGRHRNNPAELRPLRLLLDGIPYIKASVFLKNPHRVDLRYVAQQATSRTGFDLGLAFRHCRRLQARKVTRASGVPA